MQLTSDTSPSLLILGTIQDAGSPHAGCTKDCCKALFKHPDPTRMVVSLGLIDPENRMNWLFEATPDLPRQMKILKEHSPFRSEETPNGIFLTHAHIGHYSGLMYLGRESMNAKATPVYAMPRMREFLEANGPWSQLLSLKNIALQTLQDQESVQLSPQLSITPLQVPHRDEFSETVGFRIQGPNKSVLFIPDIDKWERWSTDIVTEIKKVDYAFLDATFYDNAELNYRNMAEIPHPFVVESMERFKALPQEEKKKIYFIHLNHTNPLLNSRSLQLKALRKNGFQVAEFQQIFHL
ncbi:MAG TPA: MBL fold metallo-hydrolase [Haliscomenobacter sp.]|uniref:MBL fold metallo-hydrolase n=1 Tax=Haliscomenobacter sp. TaxID=2717303 RepID=UPI002CF3D358|nr:MBL fold metallo-hydrolase [Haliscomenobacter sp.]HOY16186.1 MBL fold metallo-hydrolase [Haliscomenobacter sp.]HPH21174.1 MBL fold metallo-hydrolase [Haliscomenobacter sp.]